MGCRESKEADVTPTKRKKSDINRSIEKKKQRIATQPQLSSSLPKTSASQNDDTSLELEVLPLLVGNETLKKPSEEDVEKQKHPTAERERGSENDIAVIQENIADFRGKPHDQQQRFHLVRKEVSNAGRNGRISELHVSPSNQNTNQPASVKAHSGGVSRTLPAIDSPQSYKIREDDALKERKERFEKDIAELRENNADLMGKLRDQQQQLELQKSALTVTEMDRDEARIKIQEFQIHIDSLRKQKSINDEKYKKETDKFRTDMAKLKSKVDVLTEEKSTVLQESYKIQDELTRQLHEAYYKYQLKLNDLNQKDKELQDMTSRYSKAVSDNLLLGNASFEDLSTAHRPLKLAERFQADLNGNHWCDGFIELTDAGEDDDGALRILFTVITSVYEFCLSHRSRLLSADLNGLFFKLNDSQDSSISPETSEIPLFQVDRQREQTVLDLLRKSFNSDTVVCLKQLYKNHRQDEAVKERTSGTMMESFIELALELCWLFVIQDPPMVLKYNLPEDRRVDVELYQFYDKPSKYAKCVVWPALVLHEGGNVLCKGKVVAEPMAEQTVTPQQPADQTVTRQQPAEQTVTPRQPADQTVTRQQPAEQTVTPRQPAEQTVTPQQPAEQNVTPQQPAEQTVISGQPAEQTVTPGQPAEQTVTPQQSAELTVTPGQPAEQIVTPREPAEQTVTPGQPAEQTVTPGQPTEQTVTPRQPAKQPVTPRQPAEQTVTPQQPAEHYVTPLQPAEQTVTPQQLAEQNVTPQQPAEQTVIPGQPAEQTVTPQQPAEQTVTRQQPAEQTVTPQQSAELTVTPGQLAEQTVTPREPAEQTVTPGQPAEQTVTPGQPTEQTVTPRQTAKQTVTPGQPAEQTVTPREPAEQTVTPGQPAEQTVTPGQPTEQTVTPGQPTEQTVTPGQPTEQTVTPQQPAEQTVTPQQPAEHYVTPLQPAEQTVTPQQPAEQTVSPL